MGAAWTGPLGFLAHAVSSKRLAADNAESLMCRKFRIWTSIYISDPIFQRTY
jgi:hypothetical protein